jgi:hypothetical protein
MANADPPNDPAEQQPEELESGMALPWPMATAFTIVAFGLVAVLVVHFCVVGCSLYQRPALTKELTNALNEKSQDIDESLKLAATAAEWDTALQIRSARLTSALLGGLILIVTGTMLISAVVVGSRSPQGLWGVAESRRHWFIPGIVLSVVGAVLFGAALTTDVSIELPIGLQAIQAKYIQDTGVDDMKAIREAVEELKQQDSPSPGETTLNAVENLRKQIEEADQNILKRIEEVDQKTKSLKETVEKQAAPTDNP